MYDKCYQISQAQRYICDIKWEINSEGVREGFTEVNNKVGMVVHAYNLSTWKTVTEGWWVRGHPGLPSKFQASLDYVVRPYLKKRKK
jgi:hypothetical protein